MQNGQAAKSHGPLLWRILKMRVGFNARTLATESLRGWSRYTLNLLRELRGLGIELYLFTDRPLNNTWLRQIQSENVHVIQENGLFYFAWEQIVLPRLCRQYKIDILHCPVNYGLPLRSACKKVLTIHDAIEVAYYSRQKKPWEKLNPKNIYSYLLGYFSRQATDRVITVSEFSKKDLRRFYGLSKQQIDVVYEAADPAFVPTPKYSSADLLTKFGITAPYFFYVGGLEDRKNLEFLIQSFSHFTGKDCQLVIAGDGKNMAHLKDQANEYGIASQVSFLGSVDDEYLPSLYANSICFIYPSLYEGFGLQLVEAMGTGSAILSSRATSLPEILGSEDGLFDPHNQQELVSKMQMVLTDPDFRNLLKKNSAQRSSSFTWRKTAEKTLQIYKQVLSGH